MTTNTCIIAIKDGNKIIIAGDSAGVNNNWDIVTRKDPKVFSNGEFVIGYTSSFRMGQLLRFAFVPPKIKEHQDEYEYMCTSFIDAVRETFKNKGYSKIDNNVESGGFFIAGFRGCIYHIEGDFQVGEPSYNYFATGCGANYALGSLYSTVEMDIDTRIKKALDAAAEFSAGVRAPYYQIDSDSKKIKMLT